MISVNSEDGRNFGMVDLWIVCGFLKVEVGLALVTVLVLFG